MTPVQARLYGYLVARIDEPVSPSFEEMRVFLRVASKSSVMRVVRALEQKNLVVREAGNARTIRARRQNPCDGISSAIMLDELKRRGDLPNGR